MSFVIGRAARTLGLRDLFFFLLSGQMSLPRRQVRPSTSELQGTQNLDGFAAALSILPRLYDPEAFTQRRREMTLLGTLHKLDGRPKERTDEYSAAS